MKLLWIAALIVQFNDLEDVMMVIDEDFLSRAERERERKRKKREKKDELGAAYGCSVLLTRCAVDEPGRTVEVLRV